MRELVFDVQGNQSVGYTARAEGLDLRVEGRTVLAVQRAARAAVAAKLPEVPRMPVLRFRYEGAGSSFEVTVR